MTAQPTSTSSVLPQDDEIALRLGTANDARDLARTAAAFFVDTFGAANRREDMEAYVASAFTEEKQRAELANPNNRIWLATMSGELAGYAHVRRSAPPPASSISRRPAAEIARIYAGRKWHGRGLGAALMEACVSTAREWGADVLWLGVWERNPRAIAFYEKHGFQAIGEQPFLLGADLQRDLVMARRLTNGG
ncbi:MAG TPA: GNAT family N-acetyltransferase [Gemmatimonadaceae bacterium]|nr:GNAT family N-acetyltransferase [Gemmatimonadaceae bacterium]